jgi:large subunit ribosomal protein L4
MKAPVYNTQGEQAGTVDLPDSVFGLPWNGDLVHQALITQQANRRAPIAHTKGRGVVSGGGKKPWKQKGTGRARHGSTRSPIWKGGGVTFGPTKEKIFGKRINKKMKRKALFVSLSKAFRDHTLTVIENLATEKGKTKDVASLIVKFAPANTRESALLVLGLHHAPTMRAARNLTRTKAISADSLNVEDVMKYGRVFLAKDAISVITSHYKVSSSKRKA